MAKSKIMDMLSVKPMVTITGSKGLYFKLADVVDSEGAPGEVYFKPAFRKAAYLMKDGKNLDVITWLEVNVLLVCENKPQWMEDGWEPLRTGKYSAADGKTVYGVLINKMMTPMGTFNDNMPQMHKWVSDNAPRLQQAIDKFLVQNDGKVYQPISVIVDFMLENMSKDELQITDGPILNYDQYHALTKTYAAKAKAAYKTQIENLDKFKSGPMSEEPDELDDGDGQD